MRVGSQQRTRTEGKRHKQRGRRLSRERGREETKSELQEKAGVTPMHHQSLCTESGRVAFTEP